VAPRLEFALPPVIRVIGVPEAVQTTEVPTEVRVAVHVRTSRTEVQPQEVVATALVVAVQVREAAALAFEVPVAVHEVRVAVFEAQEVLLPDHRVAADLPADEAGADDNRPNS